MVRVICGSNDCEFDNLAGKPVAAVRKALASVFSIPKEARPEVNDMPVTEDYLLKPGDNLRFIKPEEGNQP